MNKKYLLLFTFLGESGGIPILENNFLHSLSDSVKRENFVLVTRKYVSSKLKSYILGGSLRKQLFLLARILKNENIVKIFYEFHVFPLFLFKIFLKVNFIIKIHDLYFTTSLRHFPVFILTLLNIVFAEKVIVPSHSTKDRLQKLFKYVGISCFSKKIEVVYNSCDKAFLQLNDKYVDHFNITFRDSPFQPFQYFLIVSAENIEFLIQGFLEVKKIYTHIQLVIVGDYPGYLSDSSQGIHFLGYLGKPELLQLYKNTRAVIYFNKNEGFGYIPLESLIVGTPIITNNDYAIQEILSHFGFYYSGHDQYIGLLKKFCLTQYTLDPQKDEIARHIETNFSIEQNFEKEFNLITL